MYMRWTRFFTFQLTAALCGTTVALAAWALATGIQKQNLVAKNIPGASLDITDALGVGGAVTAASGVASILCLGMQWIILQHHRGKSIPSETLKSVRMKEGAFAFATIFWLATLIPATYINATRSGTVTKPGVPAAVLKQVVALSGQKLAYKDQTPIVAYNIVGWLAFVSTVVNLILVSLAARYVLKHGATHQNSATNLNHNTHGVHARDTKETGSPASPISDNGLDEKGTEQRREIV